MISFRQSVAWGIWFMKIRVFLWNKLYVFILGILISLIEIFFFTASQSNLDTILFFMILLWVFILLILIIEYQSKVSFYKELDHLFNTLERKSLIHEMMQEPGFMEGKVLYQTLQEINKYVNDTIATYEIKEREYQEYVELWVHEIKTPLAAGKLIVANHKAPEIQSMSMELDRIDNFVEQALFYARSRSVEKDYVIKEIGLQEVVNTVIKKYQQTFLYKKIKIHMQDSAVKVYSDKKWLIFIIHQIMDNALKYTPLGGCLSIYVKEEKENTVLYLQDSGVGITAKDINRVFERGFTGENGRLYKQSTGMGLYLCKCLCDKLYIGLEVTSKEGEGVCVKLIFPLNSMMKFK